MLAEHVRLLPFWRELAGPRRASLAAGSSGIELLSEQERGLAGHSFLISFYLGRLLQRRCQCRRAASVAGRTAAHITRICDLVAAVRDVPELSGRSAPASDPRGVLAVALCRKPREVDPGVDL